MIFIKDPSQEGLVWLVDSFRSPPINTRCEKLSLKKKHDASVCSFLVGQTFVTESLLHRNSIFVHLVVVDQSRDYFLAIVSKRKIMSGEEMPLRVKLYQDVTLAKHSWKVLVCLFFVSAKFWNTEWRCVRRVSRCEGDEVGVGGGAESNEARTPPPSFLKEIGIIAKRFWMSLFLLCAIAGDHCVFEILGVSKSFFPSVVAARGCQLFVFIRLVYVLDLFCFSKIFIRFEKNVLLLI